MSKVDLLIRVSATNVKRMRRTWPDKKKTLNEQIEGINKKIWLIKKPEDKDMFQWTFLFGTNYAKFGDWKKEGFYLLNSPEGKEILIKLNFTKEEVERFKQTYTVSDMELKIGI